MIEVNDYGGVEHWAYTIKPEADLKGANLFRANLRGAELMDADLREADFYKADLTDSNLRGADLKGANLFGVKLRDADLTGANLEGARELDTANYGNTLINEGNYTIIEQAFAERHRHISDASRREEVIAQSIEHLRDLFVIVQDNCSVESKAAAELAAEIIKVEKLLC